jgi:hypothetical protein
MKNKLNTTRVEGYGSSVRALALHAQDFGFNPKDHKKKKDKE